MLPLADIHTDHNVDSAGSGTTGDLQLKGISVEEENTCTVGESAAVTISGGNIYSLTIWATGQATVSSGNFDYLANRGKLTITGGKE